jgi:hypothetical protein
MAKEDQSLKGKIGPVVVYRLNGDTIVRSLPGFYKRTPAMKARALNFGIAARVGAKLRSGLKNVLPFPRDSDMRSRLTGAISKWMGKTPVTELSPVKNIPYLADFHFNSKAELNSRWKGLLKADVLEQGELVLSIPAFIPVDTIYAPAGTETIECRIGAASCSLADSSLEEVFYTSILFSMDKHEVAAQQIPLPVPVEAGHIVLVVLSMIYNINKNGKLMEKMEPAFRPADVISAMYF